MAELRRRRPGSEPGNAELDTPPDDKPEPSKELLDPQSWNPKLLLLTAAVFAAVLLVTQSAFARVPPPLPRDAPPTRFAEGRALKHVRYLADHIGERQVSTAGEEEAAQYLLKHANHIAAAAQKHRPDLEVTVEREQVSGGVTMSAFKFEIANVYNNLTNVVIRVAPRGSTAKAVLVNSHYDSTLGTPGASDAASCVGVIMELARTVVADASIQLRAPVVFLMNGGEETLSQAAHGFMRSSKYAQGLGAFINLESTGPWGPDVVFQHTGDWTLGAYARSAPNPRGTTVAQDFFDLGLIPADTDYRMLSYRHYGSLPGIDIAFIGDGTAYHTARDEVDRIRPGTLQAMGENVLAAIQEFTGVLSGSPPAPSAAHASGYAYFDLLGKVMVVYPHWLARLLHSAPLPALGLLALSGAGGVTLGALSGGLLLGLLSLLLGLLFPAAVGALRANHYRLPYVWYGKPAVAYAIYVPAAVAGLMLPYVLQSWQGRVKRARMQSLGLAFLSAAFSAALTVIGFHSAFLFASWAAAGAGALLLLGAAQRSVAGRGRQLGLGQTLVLLALAAGPAVVCMPTALSITGHVMEKIGLAGAAPGPVGRYIGDAAVGAVCGASALLALGILTPHLVAALGRGGRYTVLLLLAASAGAAVWASKTQPVYTYHHPKRILVQHIHKQGPQGDVEDSLYSFASLDNTLLTKVLPKPIIHSHKTSYRNRDWEAFYPLNHLVLGLARAAPAPQYNDEFLPLPGPPTLALLSREDVPPLQGSQDPALERLTLELNTHLGAWGVLNMTGDVRAWSLSDKVARGPGGSRSHMVRYAANAASGRYTFTLDVPKGETIDIQLFVKYVPLSLELQMLKNTLSGLVSPALVTTYQSMHSFGGGPGAAAVPAGAAGAGPARRQVEEEEGEIVWEELPAEHAQQHVAPAPAPPAEAHAQAAQPAAEPAAASSGAVPAEALESARREAEVQDADIIAGIGRGGGSLEVQGVAAEEEALRATLAERAQQAQRAQQGESETGGGTEGGEQPAAAAE